MNVNLSVNLAAVREALNLATTAGYEPSGELADALAAHHAVTAATLPEPGPLHAFAPTASAKKPDAIAAALAAHADYAARRAEHDRARAELADLVARRILAAAGGWPAGPAMIAALGARFDTVAAEFTTAAAALPDNLDPEALLRAGSETVAAWERAQAAHADLKALRNARDTLEALARPRRLDLAADLRRFWTPTTDDAAAEALRLIQHHRGRLSPWRELAQHGALVWHATDAAEAEAAAHADRTATTPKRRAGFPVVARII